MWTFLGAGTALLALAGCWAPLTPSYVSGEQTMSVRTQGVEKIEHVSESTFDQAVLRSPIPVLVDFYADWCGPCQMLTPVLEEIAAENATAKVVKINVDDNPQLANRYRISSIPSLLVFKGGKLAAQHVGLASKARLETLLTR